MKHLAPLAALLLGLVIATCTDSQAPVPPPPSGLMPPPPQALVLKLNSPVQDDGAILLELRGPALDSVTAPDSSLTFSSEQVSDTVLRALVVGNVSNVEVLKVKLNRGNHPTSYHATIIDVASRSGALRDSVRTYSVEIVGQ